MILLRKAGGGPRWEDVVLGLGLVVFVAVMAFLVVWLWGGG